MLQKSGRAEDALDSYHLAVHFSPALAAAHIALAAALSGRQSHADAEEQCRQALALDGTSPAAWFCLGNVLKARGALAEAVEAYRMAVQYAPADINAWQQLAFVESRLGRYDEAYRDFRTLLGLAPDSYRAHHNLGLLQLETGYPEEALASFRRAIELNPGTPESLTCSGHALRDLGRVDEAIAAYDEVLKRHPDSGDASSNRSQALLLRGDFSAGWSQYEKRFIASGKRARTVGVPVWRGENLSGKSIAVLSEQGVGDEIMFASCLPDLMAVAGRVVIECDPRLVPVFARSFAQAVVQPRDDQPQATAGRRGEVDFEISIGSLPLHFRTGRQSFPRTVGYLRADPDSVSRWKKIYAEHQALRVVGISWRGGVLRNRQHLRSLEPGGLMPVLRQSGTGFVSLQHGDHSEDLQALRKKFGIVVRDVMPAIGAGIDELAAAIEALDRVVTVDNTIAHLSGALGKNTCVLVPFSPEWRYGRHGDAMPWYPSVRLFRQTEPRSWSAAVAQIAQTFDESGASPHA